jgi:hypothetical protein
MTVPPTAIVPHSPARVFWSSLVCVGIVLTLLSEASTAVTKPAPLDPSSARTRKRLLLVAGVFFLGLCVCVATMIVAIHRFNTDNPRKLFAIKRVYEREFAYAGRPVRFVDVFPAGTSTTHKDGRASFNSPETPADAVDVVFGNDEGGASPAARVRIPVQVPASVTLPDLLAHNDYLRVIRMVEATGTDTREVLAKMERGEATTQPDRLLVVSRVPPPLPTPEEMRTWGSVWKKRWSFDIYELMPDGTIRQERRLRYPTGGPFKQAKEGELQDNTWQFAAALTTMPQEGGIGPTVKLFNNALRAANIALPGAMFCGLGLSLCLAFAFAPPKRVK